MPDCPFEHKQGNVPALPVSCDDLEIAKNKRHRLRIRRNILRNLCRLFFYSSLESKRGCPNGQP